MKSNIIYLRISGFTFKFIFHDTEYHYSKELFLKMFRSSFKGFFVAESNQKPHFSIHIIQKNEVKVWRQNNENYIEFYSTAKKRNNITTFYTISIQQLSLLIRYALQSLLRDNGFFMHGACSIFDNNANIFLGDSGTGKSTILKLAKKFTTPFADDIFIIRKIGRDYICFQSPIFDKQRWIIKNHLGYKIRNIYFLEHSNKFEIRNLTKEEILQGCMKQVVYTNSTKYFLTNCFQFINQQYNKTKKLYFQKKDTHLKEVFL